MNPSNPLQSGEPGIGNDSFYAASAVSPNANHQVPRVPLFTIDRVANPLPNAAQTLEDQYCEEPKSQQLFCDCSTLVWHRDIHLNIHLYARQQEEYSNEAHFSAVKAAIQPETLSDTNLQTKMIFPWTLKPKMMIVIRYSRTPPRPPSSRKISLECFLSVQSLTGRLKCATTLNFVFVHVQVIPDHGGKTIISLFMMIMDERELP